MNKVMGLVPVTSILALLAFTLPLSCKARQESQSATKSDFEGPADTSGSRNYVIDWPCEPKRYDSSAETELSEQDEYCEWRVEQGQANQKQCRFTTSFDSSRDFFLNSRGATRFNSIGAAQALRDDCATTALKRLGKGLAAGRNCSSISANNCVATRNSDPEICDKVRWVVGQNYNKKLDFAIDQMPPNGKDYSKMTLMRLNLLTSLPAGCQYSRPDKTEVLCTIDRSRDCFSLTGQMRASIRVVTTPFGSKAAAPAEVTPGTAGSANTPPPPSPEEGLALSNGVEDDRNPGMTGFYPEDDGNPEAPIPEL